MKMQLKHKYQRRVKGATLIETTIYIFLLMVFILIITQSFISILDVGKESESQSGIENDARFIIARLTYDVLNSDIISLPANPGESSNSLTLTLNGDTLTYSLNNQNLMLADSQGSDALNSINSQVTNLSFERLGNIGGKNLISLSFTLRSEIKQSSGQETKNYEIILGTR